MSDGELKRISVKIDDNLKTDLKMIALKKKTTMTDIVVNEIKQYIEANKDLLE